MKNSIIKLKSRGYLIGYLPLLSLLVVTLLVFSVCLNILPETANQLLQSQPEKVRGAAIIAISFLVIFILFFVFSCFDMGMCRFFLRKAQRSGGKVKDLFYYFSPTESFRLLGFFIRYMMMKFLLFSLCYLPFGLLLIFFLRLIKSSVSLNISFIFLCTLALLFLSGSIFMGVINDSLFLVKYYYAKGCYLDFRQLVSSSQSEMRKRVKAPSRLRISFIWWFLSCFLVVPSLYVFLYYRQSKAVLASEIMEE